MTGFVIHTLCYIFKGTNWRYNHVCTVWRGELLSETRDDAASGNESDDYSTLAPLNIEEEMNVMSSGDEYDAEPMVVDMSEDICDISQYHPSINRIEACYKIRDHIKWVQAECKVALLSTQNIIKGLNKVFKAVVNNILQDLPFFGELAQKFLTSFQNL